MLFRSGYTHQEMDVQKGDMVYVFSDGYTDQFGGDDNRKFLMSNFKKLLVDVHQLPVNEQKDKMEEVLFDWMKYESQLDDILVIGIRV